MRVKGAQQGGIRGIADSRGRAGGRIVEGTALHRNQTNRHRGRGMMHRDAFLVRVVDDDAAVRDSLEALLVVAGYEVATFGSAEEYLAAPLDNPGDGGCGCILLDLHMPGIGGFGLLEALRGRRARLPVAVLTAAREDALHERARALGARLVLTKPVPQAVLLDALAALGGSARI